MVYMCIIFRLFSALETMV